MFILGKNFIISFGETKGDVFDDIRNRIRSEDNNLSFYGIPDEKQTVLNLYGQEVNLFKLGRMPAQMLIDKNGILRYVHYGHSMKDIPENLKYSCL